MARIKPLHGVSVLFALAAGAIAPVQAQDFPPCPPPAQAEYLLLVQGETEPERTRIQNLLPTSTEVMVCQYLSDPVVRAGGFTSLENANAWAQYLTEVEGAQAFVVRPAAPGEAIAAIPAPDAPSPAAPSAPATPVVGYAPQLLGEGYAVLVAYENDPTTAIRVQQTLGMPVGLAVYQQQPYLLAIQSGDPQAAVATLQTLATDRFTAFMVDSSNVVLLSPTVVVPLAP